MRLYVELMRLAVRARTAYRMEALLLLVSQVLALLIEVAIWRALLLSPSSPVSASIPVTLHDMTTYVIVSRGISTFVSMFAAYSPLWRVDEKIQTGEIAFDLIKPIKLRTSLFFETLGNNLFEIVFGLVPLVGLGAILFGFQVPPLATFCLFLMALVNGLVIYFLLSYITGLLGFWYFQVYHLERVLADLMTLLSGAFIPLWFFPESLQTLSLLLPFRLIYHAPLAIYLGKVSLAATLSLIGQQVLWIGILWQIERVVWRRGTTKLVVQGG